MIKKNADGELIVVPLFFLLFAVLTILRRVSGLSNTSLAKTFRGVKDTSAAGKEAARKGCVGAGKSLNLKINEVDKIIRRMITLGIIEEQLENHEGRATIAKLAVDERRVAVLTDGGRRPLKVEVTELGQVGSAPPPAAVANGGANGGASGAGNYNTHGAGPSNGVAIATAPAEKKKKAATKKKAKGTPTAAAAAVGPSVINLVSDDDEDEEQQDKVDNIETYYAKHPEEKPRFDVMLIMLSQLSQALKAHTAGRRIPLSTSIQKELARNPPVTLKDINTMKLSGFSTQMKGRFGRALLAGVAQADAHLRKVQANEATIEDFVLDKQACLAGLAAGNGTNNGTVAAAAINTTRAGQYIQQEQQYYYPQPEKKTNAMDSALNKRPREEDVDWGETDDDDNDDDDDAWIGAALNGQPAALAPYQQQRPQQRQQQQRQQPPPPRATAAALTTTFPTSISAVRPGNNTANYNNDNEAIPLKQLKTKLQQDVASQGRGPFTTTTNPGQVKSVAVKDINNAFG